MTTTETDLIKRGFIAALLWANEWDDLDASDLSDEAIEAVDKIIQQFAGDFPGLCERPEDFRTTSWDPTQGSLFDYLGHDLALSILRTGSGFFDKRYGDLDKFLMAWCARRPDPQPYLGDDGKVYFQL